MTEIKKILYATDFSDLAACALPHAVYLAEKCGASLHCVHVVDDSYQYWLTFDVATVPTGLPVEELTAAAEKQLEKFVEDNVPEGIPTTRAILHGRPFAQIVRYAGEKGIDLIVMGTHGWSALREVLVGSVADKVIRKSPCPVLTVRHPDRGSDAP